MLTLSFENRDSLSLYEYLYRSIRDAIRTGQLAAGEKLPSKRALARHNGISVMTVENAYGQLLSEGYILSLPRKGFFVADLPTMAESVRKAEPVSPVPVQRREWLADFTSNQTRSENFPFSTWSRIVRRVLSEDQEKLLTNPPWGGIPELRAAIAEHLSNFRGLQVQPEQILIGAGTEYLYGLLVQLIGLDRTYAVEDPGYDKVRHIFDSHGVRCETVAMDESGIRIPELELREVDVVHISPAHHFPTGRVMPVIRRHELLKWASAADRYIIEDDYDSEFRMEGLPIPTLQSIDRHERVIYMNTFSKTLASTVRISYMVLPPHLLERFRSQLSFYSCTVSTIEQYTLADFIRQGYFEKHLNRMRTDYHRRRDELLKLLREHPDAALLRVSEEDAGLHFLIRVRTEQEDAAFCRRAADYGIRISPLSLFYRDASKKTLHTFVINYSSLSREVMSEAVQRLYQVIRQG